MTEAEALAAAVIAEDAVVYAYGVLGPHLADADRDLVRGALAAHRARAFTLRERILAGGGAGPDTPVAYDLPFVVDDDVSARRLAALVEMRLAAHYADLAAATSGSSRSDAVLAARESAVRAIGWGAVPEAFPGLAP